MSTTTAEAEPTAEEAPPPAVNAHDLFADVNAAWARTMHHPALMAEECSSEDALDQIMRMECLAKSLRDAAALVEKARQGFGMEQVARHGEAAMFPYRVGVEKDEWSRDVKATLTGMLDVAAGDFDAVADCLSSNAWKPGAAKKLLGTRWGEFFTTFEEERLKESTGKKAAAAKEPRLLRINQFAR
jgi:hypothetical protein